MPSPPWPQLIVFSTFLQCAEACFDSSGDFYCTTLWYFWFSIFWIFIFIFIGIICIVNHCNKKNTQVDVQFPLPPLHSERNGVDASLFTARESAA